MDSTIKKRAVGYCRRAMSKGATTSVDRQAERLEEYAAKHGLILVDVIKDNNVSAYGDKLPPGVERIISMADEKLIDVVIVDQVARWSRNARLGSSSIQKLEEAGVEFIALDLEAANGR